MRLKSDYMGNDQLLPACNMQAAICDEYIAVIDAKHYATDMECFVPLMEKFNALYGHMAVLKKYMNARTAPAARTEINAVKR